MLYSISLPGLTQAFPQVSPILLLASAGSCCTKLVLCSPSCAMQGQSSSTFWCWSFEPVGVLSWGQILDVGAFLSFPFLVLCWLDSALLPQNITAVDCIQGSWGLSRKPIDQSLWVWIRGSFGALASERPVCVKWQSSSNYTYSCFLTHI